jgi:2-dehydropantoate 2-reductase
MAFMQGPLLAKAMFIGMETTLAAGRGVTMLKIAVLGAGLVGVYIGGRLAHGGADVTLVGRARVLDPLAAGVRLSDLAGYDARVTTLRLATDPVALADADLIVVTVKSQHSAGAAADIAAHAGADAIVLSLQNGVSNADRLAAALPGRTVLAGMVPFNVAARAADHYHQGSGGAITVADHPALQAYTPAFAAAGLPLKFAADMPGVLWGKLLVNLNNAINALSGVPLAQQLAQRQYRACWALCLAEGLRLLRPTGIVPIDPLPIPLKLLPLVLPLPTPLYRRIVTRGGKARGGGVRVDPHARSSMADDLALGRATEVDWINGELLRLAQLQGRAAPRNARVIDLIRAAEHGAAPWSAELLLKTLQTAR